jgi:hypothetical protein
LGSAEHANELDLFSLPRKPDTNSARGARRSDQPQHMANATVVAKFNAFFPPQLPRNLGIDTAGGARTFLSAFSVSNHGG